MTLRSDQERLLSERTAREERAAGVAVTTTLGGAALALVLLVAATALMAKAVRERSREHAARTAVEAVKAAVAASEERLRVTLASIGDAVIATDDQGRVTLVNAVASALTGWSDADAAGRPLEEIFVILNEESRRPAETPILRVLREGVITGLANSAEREVKARRALV